MRWARTRKVFANFTILPPSQLRRRAHHPSVRDIDFSLLTHSLTLFPRLVSFCVQNFPLTHSVWKYTQIFRGFVYVERKILFLFLFFSAYRQNFGDDFSHRQTPEINSQEIFVFKFCTTQKNYFFTKSL